MTSLITQLKAAAKLATPGPWACDDGAIDTSTGEESRTGFTPWPGQCEYENCDADSEYIALCSPENILALCEALDEARELLQGLTEFHPDSCAYFQGSECDCFLGAKHQQAGQKARAWLKKYGSSN